MNEDHEARRTANWTAAAIAAGAGTLPDDTLARLVASMKRYSDHERRTAVAHLNGRLQEMGRYAKRQGDLLVAVRDAVGAPGIPMLPGHVRELAQRAAAPHRDVNGAPIKDEEGARS